MKYRISLLLAVLATYGWFVCPAGAQGKNVDEPTDEVEVVNWDFFNEGELSPNVALSGKQFFIPNVFGPTGMNGWILNDTLVVREVEAGSPADGIVLANDVILAVNGRKLSGEPLKTSAEQVEVSEQTGRMKLQVRRGKEEKALTIPIRKLGAFGKDWPYDDAKSRAILHRRVQLPRADPEHRRARSTRRSTSASLSTG